MSTRKRLLGRRNRRIRRLTLILLILALIFAWFWYRNHRFVSTGDAYVRGNVIPVEALVSGTVVEVAAEDTQFVREGQILVRLQGHRAQIALEKAKADLAAAVRRVQAAFDETEVLHHRLDAQTARVKRIQHDLQRFRWVVEEGGVSQKTLQNTEDRLRELRARVRETRADLRRTESQIQGTEVDNHPWVEQAKSALETAYLDFVRQTIVAPASGFVAKRKIQVGDRVSTGTPLLTLVPLDHLWVEAYLLETKLAPVRPGQRAEISVDMYGSRRTYHGVVEGILPATGSTFALIPPDTATGNFIRIRQRVGVRIGLFPEELRRHPLRPGLSTVTRIAVGRRGLTWAGERGSQPSNEVKTEASPPPREERRFETDVLRSLATTEAPAYRSQAYANELQAVESLSQRIIEANRRKR
ncbi:HlyD family secretion protein [Methylohalobius crimeensis]|uniref:HlyD family secretion protein n=1 Tax=Methylohalobius crimeensis TaxID=244365 RepID=UPI0003B46EA4|nr:HlyD family secretion protein [Methylohalobius crimeensis]